MFHFSAKMLNIVRLQLLRCVCYCKLNIEYVYKQYKDVTLGFMKMWRASGTIFWHFIGQTINWLIEKIICIACIIAPFVSLCTLQQSQEFCSCVLFAAEKSSLGLLVPSDMEVSQTHTHNTKRDLDGGRGSPQLYLCCNAGKWQHVTEGGGTRGGKSTLITLEQSGWPGAASVNKNKII